MLYHSCYFEVNVSNQIYSKALEKILGMHAVMILSHNRTKIAPFTEGIVLCNDYIVLTC